ncbi:MULTISPECIES: helix-turn-helix transcriptional regulator [Micromonospora]|uniref:helix-turn-helix transcriptional regulator n=1 Tax=Micromonospora TaxID=1873 RepID=UPI0004BEAE5A|nr:MULTISPECIES: helix-turn-helix domain-containing protein [Micromonospora]
MPTTAAPRRERMASLAEVAEYLGVSPQTLYNWRHKGIGPKSRKVGGLVKYRLADVDAWLESRSRGDAG